MKDKEKKSFKELWSNKQSRAIIKLVMWFFFFFITFLFLLIASLFVKNPKPQNNNLIEEKVDINMIAILTKLKDSNYSYEYKITSDEYLYNLNGTKEKEKNIGFYENGNEIFKYQVINNKYYKIEDSNLTEEIIVNENDTKYLNLNNIINIIKEFEENNEVIVKEDYYVYNINENYIITIRKNGNNINSIDIKVENVDYFLEYKNIVN